MNWSLREFSHAERTGEQLVDSSNDSNIVGRDAFPYRLVYSCRTSINFFRHNNQVKDNHLCSKYPPSGKTFSCTGDIHQNRSIHTLLLSHPISFGHKMLYIIDISQSNHT